MKACPNCGYVPSLSTRALLRLYGKHFGSIPVWDMLERGWITVSDRESVSELKQVLCVFYGCESEEDWQALLAKAEVAAPARPQGGRGGEAK